MTDFMNYDFNVEKIVLACFVPAGIGQVTHKNRPSHGLAINKFGEKIYSFSDGKQLVVKENDIIFLENKSITIQINLFSIKRIQR